MFLVRRVHAIIVPELLYRANSGAMTSDCHIIPGAPEAKAVPGFRSEQGTNGRWGESMHDGSWHMFYSTVVEAMRGKAAWRWSCVMVLHCVVGRTSARLHFGWCTAPLRNTAPPPCCPCLAPFPLAKKLRHHSTTLDSSALPKFQASKVQPPSRAICQIRCIRAPVPPDSRR